MWPWYVSPDRKWCLLMQDILLTSSLNWLLCLVPVAVLGKYVHRWVRVFPISCFLRSTAWSSKHCITYNICSYIETFVQRASLKPYFARTRWLVQKFGIPLLLCGVYGFGGKRRFAGFSDGWMFFISLLPICPLAGAPWSNSVWSHDLWPVTTCQVYNSWRNSSGAHIVIPNRSGRGSTPFQHTIHNHLWCE